MAQCGHGRDLLATREPAPRATFYTLRARSTAETARSTQGRRTTEEGAAAPGKGGYRDICTRNNNTRIVCK